MGITLNPFTGQFDITGSSGGGGGSVNSVTASGPLASTGGSNPNISLSGIVPVANGGTGLSAPGTSGNVLTSNGTIWVSSAPAAAGANTALSNLTNPTSINQNLLPDADATRSLGSLSLRWANGYIANLRDSGSNVSIAVENRSLNSTTGTAIASFSTTGIFGLVGGAALNLSGSTSGTISIRAADTTTNYSIKYPAAQGAASTVLTNDGSGNLSWAAGGSGANTALSNLITTSINQTLTPDANLTRDLGTNGTRWRDAYIRNLKDNSAAISISVESRYLADSGGTPVASYATGGRFSLQPAVTLDLNGATSGTLRMQAASTTTNYTVVYPAAQGSSNTYLKNDGSGNLSWASAGASLTPNKETFVLSGTDITNQYIDLAQVAQTNSILFLILGLQSAIEGASYDYTVSYTGGAGGKTRITFLNGIATGGASALVASDVIQVNYIY